MVDQLLSYATLLSVGLMSAKEYNKVLDELFLDMPEDPLLLDLEFVSSDINKTVSIIQRYCAEHPVNYDIFGRYIINGLKEAYYNYGIDIKGFALKAYALWGALPSVIALNEPFRTLSYADDPLSWCDEKQTRELYEEMFRFYDKK